MNGGYIMIDCKGLDLVKGSTPQIVNGLYNAVKRAMPCNKPIYAINAIWGDTRPVTPIQCFVIDWGDYLIATASTLQIVISPDDSVTIVNMVGD